MPAAAVIPAPIAYLNVVAVKKLVVEILGRAGFQFGCLRPSPSAWGLDCSSLYVMHNQALYFEEIRVFQAGFRLYTPAWNNRKGLLQFYWYIWSSND